MKTINKVKALMKAQNITSYKLAKEIGASPNVVSNWVAREKIPVDWILSVAKCLKTSTDFLLDPSVAYINNTTTKEHITSPLNKSNS